jgi:hypothetical protein
MNKPYDPVILPIIRRVWPNILANELIGVQPMTGPVGEIFGRRPNGRVLMNKVHYRHFVRVYNRRKYHRPEYITSLGYTHVRVRISDAIAVQRWCREILRAGSYVRSHNDFWFAYERDATLFTLRWSE